jgi:putative transposase
MPRGARLDFPGTLHHVIIRGIEKKNIVCGDGDRQDFVGRMGKLAHQTETAIYAWALMTNHAHILIRSGPPGLSVYMRRFLTGYAAGFNRRNQRRGILFQNRYKSIVCDEETYFLELVRYIHLNPLRAGIVQTLQDLDKYRYCGHSVIMGRVKNHWQSRDYVLGRFDTREGPARRSYREFINAGIAQGRRPELVGGGLVRSHGGWAQVMSQRRQGNRELTDERILGTGMFVEQMLAEAEEKVRRQFSERERSRKTLEIIEKMCREEGVSVAELRGGGRRGILSSVRLRIARELVEDHGVAMAQVARELGVTTAAISKGLRNNHEGW